jgi:hypothetical protein
MKTELQFQDDIIKAVRKEFPEAYAIKNSHRFLAGIPDLLIHTEDYGAYAIEIKLASMTRKGTIKVDTKGIQRATMKAMQRSGMKVAVWTLVQNRELPFIVQSEYDDVEVEVNDYNTVIKLDRAWPIMEMMVWPVGRPSYLDGRGISVVY